LKDSLSKYFRDIRKMRKSSIRLDEDILEGWKRYSTVSNLHIGELRSAFKFRHWLAHGRYWTPKFGQKYDFETIYPMAEAIVSGFPFRA
jgi:hypothetical protein